MKMSWFGGQYAICPTWWVKTGSTSPVSTRGSGPGFPPAEQVSHRDGDREQGHQVPGGRVALDRTGRRSARDGAGGVAGVPGNGLSPLAQPAVTGATRAVAATIVARTVGRRRGVTGPPAPGGRARRRGHRAASGRGGGRSRRRRGRRARRR